ncbi:protein gp37 [Rhizobiales bacterium GAS188]|nr:protein gp37 [Rhizobiales bacterium GAS188]
MAETSIEWTDATWNPVGGCTILTAGCTNCYAMRMAARLDAMGIEKYRGLTRKSGGRHIWTGRVTLDERALAVPTNWKRPRRIFVNSMSDLFHERVPVDFIERVWAVMRGTRQHTYQILTKRPERMREILVNARFPVLPNVWLGTSVEDSKVLRRLDDLRLTPAKIRFVSFEPLIGSVAGADLTGIHWAIVGGESGPRARPMDEAWLREIHMLCGPAGAAFFFKQWGGRNKKATGRSYHGRTWDALPELRM